MSIELQFLGRPGEDNATLITIDGGNAIDRILFDCGERCLDSVTVSSIKDVKHVLFSHFHMDHICGFDCFFRHNYNRPDGPVTLWGPKGSIDVIHSRFRGFTWNLHHRQRGQWVVNEINGDALSAAMFLTSEAFSKRHRRKQKTIGSDRQIFQHKYFTISAHAMNHGTIDSMGYRIDEPDKENVDPKKLKKSGYKPGPWVRILKDSHSGDQGEVEIDGVSVSIQDLRKQLIVQTQGQSVAFLTDFIIEPGSKEWQETVAWLKQTNTLVCESQYIESDYSYAKSNFHMTAKRVAQLAVDAEVDQLIIQHVSRRYSRDEWKDMLAEAQAVFPNTSFPPNWRL